MSNRNTPALTTKLVSHWVNLHVVLTQMVNDLIVFNVFVLVWIWFTFAINAVIQQFSKMHSKMTLLTVWKITISSLKYLMLTESLAGHKQNYALMEIISGKFIICSEIKLTWNFIIQFHAEDMYNQLANVSKAQHWRSVLQLNLLVNF